MWNRDALVINDDLSEHEYTLSEDIRAIELDAAPTDERCLGPVSKIPEGAEIECCGPGFNEGTVKVRWRGKFYFVFLEDLESQRKPSAMCACNRN